MHERYMSSLAHVVICKVCMSRMYDITLHSDVGSHKQGGTSDVELEGQFPQPQPAFITTSINDKVGPLYNDGYGKC